MAYKIKYHRLVLTVDVPKLPRKIQLQIEKAIREKIGVHPEQFGKPLRKSLKGHRRLRIGDYRILYSSADETITIWAILHRSIIYKESLKRLIW